MTSTFICEWDSDNIYTLIIAEDALRRKADELKDKLYAIADEKIDGKIEEVEVSNC